MEAWTDPAQDEQSEDDRFKDLTERLLRVPKKELDEARKREAAKKG
jgi:hypothetical protein